MYRPEAFLTAIACLSYFASPTAAAALPQLAYIAPQPAGNETPAMPWVPPSPSTPHASPLTRRSPPTATTPNPTQHNLIAAISFPDANHTALAADAPYAGPAAPADLVALIDHYLYAAPLADFLAYRQSPAHDARLLFATDGCTDAPDRPLGLDFAPACARHDFGYANLWAWGLLTPPAKRAVDARFLADMRGVCAAARGPRARVCRGLARTYWWFVARKDGAFVRAVRLLVQFLQDPWHNIVRPQGAAGGGEESRCRAVGGRPGLRDCTLA